MDENKFELDQSYSEGSFLETHVKVAVNGREINSTFGNTEARHFVWLWKRQQSKVSSAGSTCFCKNTFVCSCWRHRTGLGSDWSVLFRWFVELAPICELLEKVSEIRASEIKLPTGRVFQKYVYTCFMVKMRINFRSFGLFWLNLGWG